MNAFLQQGPNACPFLWYPDGETVNSNYPPPNNQMFNDPNLDWGDDIVPDNPSEDGTPNRYYYTDNTHIAAAKTWYRAGPYDPVTNTSPNMPRLYNMTSCQAHDVEETWIRSMEFRIFGLEYGAPDSPEPTPIPSGIGTTLEMKKVLAGANDDFPYNPIGYEPDYGQSSSVPDGNSLINPLYEMAQSNIGGADLPVGPYNWDNFHYVPMPLFAPPGIPYSMLNDYLMVEYFNWTSQGTSGGGEGTSGGEGGGGGGGVPGFEPGFEDYPGLLTLQIRNLIVNPYMPATYPFTSFEIQVEPTAYAYVPPWRDLELNWDGGQVETITLHNTYYNRLQFFSTPDPNQNYDLRIQGIRIKSTPPDQDEISESPWWDPDFGTSGGYPIDIRSGTEMLHENWIWTIYLNVTIKNAFVTESITRICVRFGITSWGGPSSLQGF